MPTLSEKRDNLLAVLRSLKSCAVAYSGGVDSAVVLKAAHLALGDKAIAVTGTSASLATGELEEARALAQLIGIRHVTIATNEFNDHNYLKNATDRCYHCKSELYSQMDNLAESLGVEFVVNGTNLDDLGDYRPGLTAAQEHQVRSPLVECQINKADVRALAVEWQLPAWDKPASPCLSSRVMYGEPVTPDRLEMIDQAESYLRAIGLRMVRVRFHRNELARIEISVEELPRLVEPHVRESLVAKFKSLGFRFVSLDLEGFRSGSMNSIVQLKIQPRSIGS